jgi:hypothetical protein
MQEMISSYEILLRKGRYHFGGLGIDGRITLKVILKKCVVRVWSGFNWFGTGSSVRIV